MAWPSWTYVTPKFQGVAKVFARVAGALILAYACAGCISAWLRRSNPPTTFSVQDGLAVGHDGQTHWGHLPYVHLQTSNAFTQGDSKANIKVTGGEGPNHVWWFGNPDKLSWNASAGNASLGNQSVTFNLTAASLTTDNHEGLIAKFAVRYSTAHSWDERHLYAHASSSPKLPSPFPVDTDIVVLEDNVLHRLTLLMTKKLQPQQDVFWGFPGGGEGVEPKYMLQSSQMNKLVAWPSQHDPKPNLILSICIADAHVGKLAPVGLLKQFVQVAAVVGGLVSGFSTIFYMVFTRKNPLSAQEFHIMELTLNEHLTGPCHFCQHEPTYDHCHSGQAAGES